MQTGQLARDYGARRVLLVTDPGIVAAGHAGRIQGYLEAAGLDVFDLRWWLDHLLPICDQFVRAARGEIDLPHWRSICKLEEA